MNGTLNASVSSNNAAYARIKALEKQLEALKSEVNVDSSQIEAIQKEIAKYKADMSETITSGNITAANNLTSNGSTHVKNLTADERITAVKGIDARTDIVIGDEESKTQITGNAVQTTEVSAAVVSASGKVGTERLEANEASIGNLEIAENITVNGSTTTKGKASFNDVEINHDLSFPKVDSNIWGEYLTIHAKDMDLAGSVNINKDLQVKGATTIDGSLVCKDTLVAKNIVGQFVLDDINVTSATVKDLLTTTPVTSTKAVGFNNDGKLIPIKATGGGGGTAGVAESLETEAVILDLLTSQKTKEFEGQILYSHKLNEDEDYLVVISGATNVTINIYHYKTDTLESKAILTETDLAKNPLYQTPSVLYVNDRLYFYSTAENKLKYFDVATKTIIDIDTGITATFKCFNDMCRDTDSGYFAFYTDDAETKVTHIYDLRNNTLIVEDATGVKAGTYGNYYFPIDLTSEDALSYQINILLNSDTQAYSINADASKLSYFKKGETEKPVYKDMVYPLSIPQNNMSIFDDPVDGKASVVFTSETNLVEFASSTGTAISVQDIKLQTANVDLRLKPVSNDLQIQDNTGRTLVTVPGYIIGFYISGFDTVCRGIVNSLVCPVYESQQNVLINSTTAKFGSLKSFSIESTPIYLDGKRIIDGRHYDYALSDSQDIEKLLKTLYTDGNQTQLGRYTDLNIYLEDQTYFLRNDILKTFRKDKTLYGLHFYGASKEGVVIQAVGFDNPGTPVAGETKTYSLTERYPMFDKSSFDNLTIKITAGQLSTKAEFKNCIIETNCTGWMLPFYGYSFDKCSLTATGTLKSSIETGSTSNNVYAAEIYNTAVQRNRVFDDNIIITLIKAQHVRDCDINMQSLTLMNQTKSYNNLYLMVPFSAPSDASFERNTFTDIESSVNNAGTAVDTHLMPLPKINGDRDIDSYNSWLGFKGNVFTAMPNVSKKLNLMYAAVEKFKVNTTKEGFPTAYVYNFQWDYLAKLGSISLDDLMTNNFYTITDRTV